MGGRTSKQAGSVGKEGPKAEITGQGAGRENCNAESKRRQTGQDYTAAENKRKRIGIQRKTGDLGIQFQP